MTKSLLKNKLTTAFSLMLFMALVPMMAQKKVLFICNSAFNALPPPAVNVATSSLPEADPFIKLLQADPAHFTVTTKLTTDGASIITEYGSIAAVYDAFDLIVTQESFGSASVLWKPAGLLGIKNITKPIIYTKGFALRTGLALTDVTGTPTGNVTATAVLGSKLAITVDPAKQSHPIFTGIDFTAGNDIAIFKQLASDPGAVGIAASTKAVDQIYNVNITDSPVGELANQKLTLLAEINPAAAPAGGAVPAVGNPNAIACVNDIPGGTYFGTAGDMLPTTSRMIFFAYNYGAVAAGFSTGLAADSNVTDAGLKIFKNAALLLTGQSLGVKDNALASNSVSVSPNPTNGVVVVNSTDGVKSITVFDTTGKKILSASNTTTVNLSNQAKGIYLVQVQTENGSTTKKVVVE